MLAAIVRKFASREAVMATAAQVAVTWGVNHLGTVITTQEDELDALRAQVELLTTERDEMRHTIDAMLGPDVVKAYPTAEDTDPLERATADLETALNTEA